jgi:hypothetical protein
MTAPMALPLARTVVLAGHGALARMSQISAPPLPLCLARENTGRIPARSRRLCWTTRSETPSIGAYSSSILTTGSPGSASSACSLAWSSVLGVKTVLLTAGEGHCEWPEDRHVVVLKHVNRLVLTVHQVPLSICLALCCGRRPRGRSGGHAAPATSHLSLERINRFLGIAYGRIRVHLRRKIIATPKETRRPGRINRPSTPEAVVRLRADAGPRVVPRPQSVPATRGSRLSRRGRSPQSPLPADRAPQRQRPTGRRPAGAG